MAIPLDKNRYNIKKCRDAIRQMREAASTLEGHYDIGMDFQEEILDLMGRLEALTLDDLDYYDI